MSHHNKFDDCSLQEIYNKTLNCLYNINYFEKPPTKEEMKAAILALQEFSGYSIQELKDLLSEMI